nr:replication initiation protein [Carnobacterium iners]
MREADKDYGKKKTVLSGTPDEFKEWLGAPESYAFKDLNKNVFQKAINEINLKINDMELEMFTANRGRKVVQVDIRNHFIKNINLIDNNLQKVPLDDWTK